MSRWLLHWLACLEETVDAEIICVIDMLAWRKIIFVRYYRAAVITAESHHPRRLVQREQWVVNILAAAMWEADKCREGGPGLPGQAAADPAALTGRHQNTSAFFQNSFFHNCTHKNNSIYYICPALFQILPQCWARQDCVWWDWLLPSGARDSCGRVGEQLEVAAAVRTQQQPLVSASSQSDSS